MAVSCGFSFSLFSGVCFCFPAFTHVVRKLCVNPKAVFRPLGMGGGPLPPSPPAVLPGEAELPLFSVRKYRESGFRFSGWGCWAAGTTSARRPPRRSRTAPIFRLKIPGKRFPALWVGLLGRWHSLHPPSFPEKPNCPYFPPENTGKAVFGPLGGVAGPLAAWADLHKEKRKRHPWRPVWGAACSHLNPWPGRLLGRWGRNRPKCFPGETEPAYFFAQNPRFFAGRSNHSGKIPWKDP